MRPYSNQYGQEIEQAKRNMHIYLEAEKNMGPHKNPHRGETWESIRDRIFTPAEIAKAQKFAEKVGKKIEARERAALARQAQVGTHPAQGEARA